MKIKYKIKISKINSRFTFVGHFNGAFWMGLSYGLHREREITKATKDVTDFIEAGITEVGQKAAVILGDELTRVTKRAQEKWEAIRGRKIIYSENR